MSAPPPTPFIWDGHAMVPPDTLLSALRRSLTAGNTYKLIVAEERRSIEQNRKFWAMLQEIAEQKEHCGHRYNADQWKTLFMHAWGVRVQFLPSLDNSTFVPYGTSSSKLSKRDMVELIEFIGAWAAQNGVVFRDDPVAGVFDEPR